MGHFVWLILICAPKFCSDCFVRVIFIYSSMTLAGKTYCQHFKGCYTSAAALSNWMRVKKFEISIWIVIRAQESLATTWHCWRWWFKNLLIKLRYAVANSVKISIHMTLLTWSQRKQVYEGGGKLWPLFINISLFPEPWCVISNVFLHTSVLAG